MEELQKTKQLIDVLLKKDLDSDLGTPITDSEIKSVIREMENIILDKKMYKITAYLFAIAFSVLLSYLLT